MRNTNPNQQPDEPLPPSAASGEPGGQPPRPPERPAPDEEPDEEPFPPEQLPLPLEVAKVIETWCPRYPRSADSAVSSWRPRFPRPDDKAAIPVVLPTVRKWVAAAMPPSPKAAGLHMYVVTDYALWGLSATGGLQESTLLIPDNIEHYIHVVNEQKPQRWKKYTRPVLRRVARAVNPDAWPLAAPSIGTSALKPPYLASDEKRIIAVATLPGRSDFLARMAAVCFSLGAGMKAVEIGLVRPDDVREAPGGRLAVVVSGQHPRLVPIRCDYTELMREMLEVARTTGANRFFRHAHHVSVVGHELFGKRRTDPNVETFSYVRARTTWLLAHLHAGTPVPVLQKLGGPVSQRTLEELGRSIADDLDPWEAAERGLAA